MEPGRGRAGVGIVVPDSEEHQIVNIAVFAGEGLTLSVAGRGASVDPTTGVLSISTEALRDGVEVTVTATTAVGALVGREGPIRDGDRRNRSRRRFPGLLSDL